MHLAEQVQAKIRFWTFSWRHEHCDSMKENRASDGISRELALAVAFLYRITTYVRNRPISMWWPGTN